MLNKKNTAIIFGCSPFISKLGEKHINYLIENYYHIGINSFIQEFSQTKNILFSDYAAYDCISGNVGEKPVIMSRPAYHHNFNLEKKEMPKNIEYIFDARPEVFHELDKNMLCMYKTSAHPAINYAYLNGYKNIVLCGVDLTMNWNHFYSKQYPFNDITRSYVRINKIREVLYLFKYYVNLYQLNPLSDLDIEKITMGDL